MNEGNDPIAPALEPSFELHKVRCISTLSSFRCSSCLSPAGGAEPNDLIPTASFLFQVPLLADSPLLALHLLINSKALSLLPLSPGLDALAAQASPHSFYIPHLQDQSHLFPGGTPKPAGLKHSNALQAAKPRS